MTRFYKDKRYTLITALILVYLLFPTHNSGIDAYAYASAIRKGNELIWPHHLLYCLAGRGLYILAPLTEPLVLMKILNALAAGATLWVTYRILSRLQIQRAAYFALFAGCCFGTMRFATENETYILPLFFSMAATGYFQQYLNEQRLHQLFISGFLFGAGVLFHQIHIFWYLGFIAALLFAGKIKWIHRMMFTASGGLTVAVVYYLTFRLTMFGSGSFLRDFVFHDVAEGRVQTTLQGSNFVMTPISLVRTFVQIHGYMAEMLRAYPVLWLAGFSLIFVAFVCIKRILRFTVPSESARPVFTQALAFSAGLHLLFAFYSVGNAEFMVMLPFLMVLWVACRFSLPTLPVLYLSLSMGIWNILFGLAPHRYFDLDGSRKLLGIMEQKGTFVWIVREPQKMQNMSDYYGARIHSGLIYGVHSVQANNMLLDSQPMPEVLYTDLLDRKETINRQKLLSDPNELLFAQSFKKEKLDSVYYFGGRSFIYKLVSR